MTIPESPDLPGRWRILPHRSPRAAEDLRDCLVIRNEGFVLLTDSNGNLPADNAKALGLYRDDTRYLSLWTLEIAGAELLPILSNADLGFAMEQVFICPELVNERRETVPAGSVQVRRQRVLDNGLLETLRLENFAAVPISLDICFRFAGDFADIFEVRGLRRQKRGTISRPHVHADGITLRYQGLDGKGRQTRIQFDPAPQELSETAAFFKVEIPARGSARLTASVLADSLAGSASARTSIADLRAARENWREESTRIVTDNELVNAVLERSLADVWMLLTRDDELRFVSSGIPWFNTLFGRDSCLTALMLLPYSTAIARDTLRSLALLQGRQTDASREEEPGKIVHEMRRCETALTGEVPFRRYYGSVDSTPLFVLLAAEFYRWTGDLHLMKELLPAIEAALSWMDEYGDMDGDGYVEYIRRSPNGLDNQGWKDSHDAIIDERGDFLEPPIALVEVQGYVYAAKRSIAGVYAALGFDAVAARLLGDAERLRRRINRDFWLSEGYYGLALDGAKRLSRVVASNAGHLLWTGVPLPPQARRQADRLSRRDMFTGWGIRTLSSDAPRYNPLGYHLGSVWPHDNALIAAGLHRYGASSFAQELVTRLLEAAAEFPGLRLPELFGGAARLAHHSPVPYPVACRPQAFAAAALPFALIALLGIQPDAAERQLKIVRPHLPSNINRLRISGMRVGPSLVDLDFQRKGRAVSMTVRRKGMVTVRRSA